MVMVMVLNSAYTGNPTSLPKSRSLRVPIVFCFSFNLPPEALCDQLMISVVWGRNPTIVPTILSARPA